MLTMAASRDRDADADNHHGNDDLETIHCRIVSARSTTHKGQEMPETAARHMEPSISSPGFCGRPYTERMDTRFVARIAVLAAVATLLAGCSSTATGATSSPGKPLQLRLVISSVEGTCSAPALTSDGPASACDRAGTTTYELAKSLGVVTPTSVTLPSDQGSTNSVTLELNEADTTTFGDVSREAIDKHLAIVLDGRVLSAPLVKESLTTSEMTLAFGTASEAKQVAAELRASATP